MFVQKFALLSALGFVLLSPALRSQAPQASPGNSAGHVPDVSGISLGMTEDQVKAKLGPGSIFNTGSFDDPALHGLQAGASRYVNGTTAWLFLFVNGKAAYIGYDRSFEPGSGPAADVADRHAREKYGAVPTYGMDWVYMPNGQVVPPSNTELRGCAQGAATSVFVAVMGKNGPAKAPVDYAPHAPWLRCPASVSMRILSGQGFVTDISIAERDPGPIVAEDARWDRLKAAQHNQQLDKARKAPDPF